MDANDDVRPAITMAIDVDPIDVRIVNGLAKIGLATRHRAWSEAEASGLTPTQGQILALLRASPTGLRLSELAARLAVTPPTASVAVRTLTAKGLVRKERAPADARGVVLTLTALGVRQAERAAGWSDFLLTAIGALTPPEREVFLRALVKMIRVLQERREIPVARMCVSCRFFRPYRHDDADRPHHCAFVDAAFGDRSLRLDCAEFEPAAPEFAAQNWETFNAGG
ncbi:MAG TPA: MarR family winged helix-turn-helix transcriptional regulator [Thermomicrobiales bacterium]|nr:MarR family winged helix-turn-helix transcriptional regulator [Thermomicrobiales bacterium]